MRKNIFKYQLFSIYGIIIVILTTFIFCWFYLPCFFLKDPIKVRWHKRISKFWMRLLVPLLGCSIKFNGMDYFNKNNNFIIVANHSSNFDPVVTTPFFPNANISIAKKSLSYIPILGQIFAFGSVLVDRKNKNSKLKSYIHLRDKLLLGLDVVIYPEGTRNKNKIKPLLPFKDGAFKLSIETNTPILPIVIINSEQVFHQKYFFYLKPTKIMVYILPPIFPSDYTLEKLKEIVKENMEQEIIKKK